MENTNRPIRHPDPRQKSITSRLAPGICLLTLLGACASFSEDAGMGPVSRFAKTQIGEDLSVIKTSDQAVATQQVVKRLLRRPLSAESAVRIALLNNRGLQATYNELAIAEAQAVSDSLPPNPTFSLSRIAGGGGVEIERQIAADILALATLPVRSEIAQNRLRQAQLRAIEETLRTAADVRRSYYRAVAANELSRLLAQAEATTKTTSQLASQLGETGALNKLDQAREHVFYAETAAELASTSQEAASARERLARLLGLWGDELTFKLPDALPALPKGPRLLPSIEVEAVTRRVDLQIARIELDAVSKSFGLSQATRFVSMLEVAGISKKTSDPGSPTLRERGLEAQLQIPIFDFGETKVRQAEATYLKVVNKLTEKAVNVRSEAREAYRTYRSSYEIAAHYQNEILPLRKIITEESRLRFSAMQIDVFALLQEARQRIAALRAAIEAKHSFWLAQVNLGVAIIGGGTAADEAQPKSAMSSPAETAGH